MQFGGGVLSHGRRPRRSGRRGDPDEFLDPGLFLHEVGQADTLQELVHPVAERAPDRTDAALGAVATAFVVHLVRVAVDLEDLVIAGGHHIVDGDRFGGAGQEVPAAGAAEELNLLQVQIAGRA